jgi:acyl carrier protein
MDLEEIETRIRSYIVESFLTETQAQSFRNDEDLLKVLDSLQILRMVVQLESSFGIKIADGELTAENLGSVRNLAAFIARKGP